MGQEVKLDLAKRRRSLWFWAERVLFCAGCGVQFMSRRNRRRRFCSNECQRRSRYPTRPLQTKQCARCGAQFTTDNKRTSQRKFCSPQCAGYVHAVLQSRGCLVCGAEFATRISTKRFCSKRCQRRHERRKRHRPLQTRRCDACGAEFMQRSAINRFCGKLCWSRHYAAEKLAEKLSNLPKIQQCVGCGAQFAANTIRKYCTIRCRKDHQAVLTKARRSRFWLKRCHTCGQEFTSHHGKRKYCCSRCRPSSAPQHRKRLHQQWYEANREHVKHTKLLRRINHPAAYRAERRRGKVREAALEALLRELAVPREQWPLYSRAITEMLKEGKAACQTSEALAKSPTTSQSVN